MVKDPPEVFEVVVNDNDLKPPARGTVLPPPPHGMGSSPRFAKISNALFDPKKCSDMFNSLT